MDSKAATRESPIGPCQTELVTEVVVVDKGEGEKVDGGKDRARDAV